MVRRSGILALVFPAFALVITAEAQPGVQFIQNRGQWPAPVTYRAETPGATIWVERGAILIDRYDAGALAALAHAHVQGGNDPATHRIGHHAIRLRSIGARKDPVIEPVGVRPGTYNFLIGNDPSRWAGNAHAFSALVQKDIHPGVDLRVRSTGQDLKYDLIIAPNADPERLLFTYDGADTVIVGSDRLIVRTSLGDVIETIPLAYQEVDHVRVPVSCSYRKSGSDFGFDVGPYDRSRPLVIDPTLVFSTYSGSLANNFGYTATFDRDGFLYSGSTAFGQGYPTTLGAYQVVHAGGDGLFSGTDIALTKYDTSGTFLIWSTYLGGSSDELPHSLVVNANDELFVFGTTSSPDLPTSPGAIDATFNGGPAVDLTNGLGVDMPNGVDMIVARLSADGSQLLAGTYLGGSGTDGLNTASGLRFNYADEVRGEILLDASDNVHIASCTASPDLPIPADALQSNIGGGGQDGVVFKLDASLTTIIWGTYFGGSGADAIYNIELDDQGDIHLAGGTRSTDLVTTPGALHGTFQGGSADGFVARMNDQGSELLAATYYGTPAYDQCYFADLDQEGHVYILGQTASTGTQLIVNAPYNVPNAGQFIAKLDTTLSTVLIGSRFGQGDGIPDISPTAFLVDYCDKIYVSGWGSAIQGGTLSTSGLPVTPDGQQLTTDGNDFYLAVFDIDMTGLYYATYFGGGTSAEHVDGGTSRFDRRGRVYQSVCAGCGGNSDFPIHPDPGAWSPTNNSGFCNNAVFKLDLDFPMVVAEFNASVNCHPAPVQFENISYGATDQLWSFGDGTTSTEASPSHVFPAPGPYTVTLIANNAGTCNQSDTTTRQIVVLGDGAYALPDTGICAGDAVQIGIVPIPSSTITYSWSPLDGLSDPQVANPIASPQQTTVYRLSISNGECTTTATQAVIINAPIIDAGVDRIVCGQTPVVLTADGSGTIERFQWSSSALFNDTLNSPITDSVAIVVPRSSGWYHVRQLDNSCPAQDSVFITVSLAAPSLRGDAGICLNDTARLTLIGADPGSTIVWAPDEEILSGQGTGTALVAPTETSSFDVSVLAPSGCTWEGSLTVQVSPLPGTAVTATADPMIVLSGELVQLQATPTEATSFAWTPISPLDDPTIADPLATMVSTTTFTVTVSDGICTKEATVLVEVRDLRCADPDIFVPNTFTPNGDGNNDVLFVRGRAIATMEFLVFDRWGEKVFESTDPSQGWDATFQGRPVDAAVFVYHLTAYCLDGQRYFTKGNVTVVR